MTRPVDRYAMARIFVTMKTHFDACPGVTSLGTREVAELTDKTAPGALHTLRLLQREGVVLGTADRNSLRWRLTGKELAEKYGAAYPLPEAPETGRDGRPVMRFDHHALAHVFGMDVIPPEPAKVRLIVLGVS